MSPTFAGNQRCGDKVVPLAPSVCHAFEPVDQLPFHPGFDRRPARLLRVLSIREHGAGVRNNGNVRPQLAEGQRQRSATGVADVNGGQRLPLEVSHQIVENRQGWPPPQEAPRRGRMSEEQAGPVRNDPGVDIPRVDGHVVPVKQPADDRQGGVGRPRMAPGKVRSEDQHPHAWLPSPRGHSAPLVTGRPSMPATASG